MSQLEVACPNCEKRLRVPDSAAGKKIRCKHCQHVFAIPAAAAKPVAPKVVAPKPKDEPPPPEPVKTPYADDDDEDPRLKYDVTHDPDDEVARCPFCALELDPPDAQICLNCGYDMAIRKRHAKKRVYKTTTGDVVLYWLPAVLWMMVVTFMVTCTVIVCINAPKFMEESKDLDWNLKEDVNPITQKKEMWIGPPCPMTCCIILTLGLGGAAVPVIWRRIKNPKPPEVEKKK